MTPGSKRPQEYIITEDMIRMWKNRCIADPAHTDTDECRKCQYHGKGKRDRCCDFGDEDMEKIFRSRPHPAASEREIRADERREVLDEIIKLSTMLDIDETEKWESFGRPKNDGYINGAHSGYLHAIRDIRHWIEQIKWAERRQPPSQQGGREG